MKYALDTNVVIAILRDHPKVIAAVRNHSPETVGVSTIAMHELYFGAHKSRDVDANMTRLGLLPYERLTFTQDDARVAGEIRDTLRRAGTPIGPYDTLIAGQALARDLTLVTRNTREFDRVAGLKVENWED